MTRGKDGKWIKGKKEFVINEHFPNGINFSFPAWFVAIIGIGVLMTAMGGIFKVWDGLKANREEKKAMEELRNREGMIPDYVPMFGLL